MQTLILNVVDGPDAGRKATIRSGQRLRVGKSTWADMSCSRDSKLEDVHFEISSDTREWTLQATQPDYVVQLNGSVLATSPLRHGDAISAGRSMFRVQDGNLPAIVESRDEPAASKEIDTKDVEPEVDISELMTKLGISIESEPEEPWELRPVAEELLASDRFTDAVRLVAAKIGPGESVRWEIQTYQEFLAATLPLEGELTKLVDDWLNEPTEEKRRSAEELVGKTDLGASAGWIAQTIFWSEGSMTASDLPEAPVPPFLFTDAVSSVLLLISIAPPVVEIEDVTSRILETGLQIAEATNSEATSS